MKHCFSRVLGTLLLAFLALAAPGCTGQGDDEGHGVPGPSQVRELVREVSGIHTLSITPDGSKMVYAVISNPAENATFLAVRDARVGRPLRSVSDIPIAVAVWGPDSASVAYVTFANDNQKRSLGIMADEALAPENIVDFLSYDVVSAPAWSPDGRFIALWTSRNPTEDVVESTLWLVRPDGNDLRARYGGPGARTIGTIVGDVAWSPDSSKILFSMSNGGAVNAFTVEQRRGDPKNLTPDQYRVSDLFWSPSGKTIGYAALERGDSSPRIWVMNADGSGKRSLGPIGRPVGWIPNSGELVYIAGDGAQGVSSPTARLDAVDVKTKAVRRLVEEEGVTITAATVSRDSRVFYVTAGQDGLGKIMVIE